jgi:16S rRNA (uracil1498-N3)-methyltransferase
MRLSRIHADGPLATGNTVRLPTAGAYHVSRVLRLRPGAALIVFDGRGGEYRAEITRLEEGDVEVRVGAFSPGTAESSLHLTLVQGVSRGERMDWALQKATELGVAVIVPVLTARSVVRLDDQQSVRKQDHWTAIVTSACEQCGRSKVPTVAAPQPLRDYLSTSRKDGMRLVLSPTGPASLAGLSSVPRKVELLIGPEGGLDDEELIAAQKASYMPVKLGPRVLRTETASVTALSVLQAMWGDLQ